MNRTQSHQDESRTVGLDERAAAAWQEQWRDALAKSAGVAPSLKEGPEYVDDLRRTDAERLSRLTSPRS